MSAPDPILGTDIRTGAAYEAQRRDAQSALARTQDLRRVELAENVSLVFESRATVLAALEETLRAERTVDADAVAEAVLAFTALLPAPAELVATLYVDIADPALLADRLAALAGVAESLVLEVGEHRVAGTTSARDDADAGAFRVTFELDDRIRTAIAGGAPLAVRVDHPAVRTRAVLDDTTRSSIAADVAGG